MNFIITQKQAQEIYDFISGVSVNGKAVHAASRAMLILENLQPIVEEKQPEPQRKLEKIQK